MECYINYSSYTKARSISNALKSTLSLSLSALSLTKTSRFDVSTAKPLPVKYSEFSFISNYNESLLRIKYSS